VMPMAAEQNESHGTRIEIWLRPPQPVS